MEVNFPTPVIHVSRDPRVGQTRTVSNPVPEPSVPLFVPAPHPSPAGTRATGTGHDAPLRRPRTQCRLPRRGADGLTGSGRIPLLTRREAYWRPQPESTKLSLDGVRHTSCRSEGNRDRGLLSVPTSRGVLCNPGEGPVVRDGVVGGGLDPAVDRVD